METQGKKLLRLLKTTLQSKLVNLGLIEKQITDWERLQARQKLTYSEKELIYFI